MKKNYEILPFNFGANFGATFESARVVVLPIAFESTVSYGVGTSQGPQAIINASRFMDELWDIEENGTAFNIKTSDFFTAEEIRPHKSSIKLSLGGISQAVYDFAVKYDKFPMVLGGEHSITYGCIEALQKKYKNISILHFDAHTDVLSEYEGTPFSHACVIRRLEEKKIPVVSFGVRNMNPQINKYLQKKSKKSVYFAPQLPNINEVLKKLTKNVYLTFDLDFFDPSIMPSVGTPEPGGHYWHETIKFIDELISKVNLIGADVVELKPMPGIEAPDFLAAKLVYKIISDYLKK
ncbi:MAG: agmatinase [Patescibacteria group bacterium]|jgi:agmatinase